jgi:hypothetical protein
VLFSCKFIIITKEKKMAWKLIDVRVNPLTNKDHNEFICDTDADFADLPKCNPGDTAVSAATGNVYVVNASGEWVEFGGGGADESIVGTWVFNDELTIPEELWDANVYFGFVAYHPDNGATVMTHMLFYDDGSGVCYYGDSYGIEDAYYDGDWATEECKTIKIYEEPTDQDFIAWLKANATKVA